MVANSSKAYSLLLEIYARCQCAARTTPEIKRAIAAFEQFMKPMGKRKAKTAATSASTASSSTPASTPASGATTTTTGMGSSGSTTS